LNRYTGVAGIVVAIVAICAVLLAVLLKGSVSATAPSIVALIGFLSLLITGLLTAVSVQSIGQRLNGHLREHTVTMAAANEAKTAAEAVAAVLAANTKTLERIHLDTNSTLSRTQATVIELREQLRIQGQELAEIAKRLAGPAVP
jgi:hypothetical protein